MLIDYCWSLVAAAKVMSNVGGNHRDLNCFKATKPISFPPEHLTQGLQHRHDQTSSPLDTTMCDIWRDLQPIYRDNKGLN